MRLVYMPNKSKQYAQQAVPDCRFTAAADAGRYRDRVAHSHAVRCGVRLVSRGEL